MAILCITEFPDYPPRGMPLAEQSVEFSDTPVSSKPFSSVTKSIRVIADQACALSFDGDADPTRHRMAADSERDYEVHGIKTLSVVASVRGEDVSELKALMAYSQAIQAAARLTNLEHLNQSIESLRQATNAHNAAAAAAEAAKQEAHNAHQAAVAAATQVEAHAASVQPRHDELAAREAALESREAVIAAREEAMGTKETDLASRESALIKRGESLDEEVARQISDIKAGYEAKVKELDAERQRLEAVDADLRARLEIVDKRAAENEQSAAAMRELAQRIAGPVA